MFYTPLHFAVKFDRFSIIELLIEKEANINCVDIERNTPLHYAIQSDNSEIVKYLLKNKANIFKKNKYG